MPTYQENKTYRGGFYNNSVKNGVNTHVYSAEDVRKPYDVVFTDGIKPEADGTAGDTLKVTKSGDLVISIAKGFAKLGGAWFENESPYLITLDAGGSVDRYDCVIIRNDDSESVKAPNIYIKSLSAIPTVNDLTRAGDIYEVCIAYIRVPAFATSITAGNIVDTREDGELCNVMSGVGATVVRVFRNTYFSTTAGQTAIPIGIEQFNRSRDELTVIVNGRVFAVGANYTIRNNEYIDLAIGLPVVGTRIDLEVAKNVNAAGAETVVQEVAQLREEMTATNKTLERHYYCNGVNDNVLISDMVALYLSGGFYASARFVIHGHLGITAPVSGAGTSANPYVYFNFSATGTRRAVVDFSDCSAIAPTINDGAYSVIFSGAKFTIVGANIIAENRATETVLRVSNALSGAVRFDNCLFKVTGYRDSMVASHGTFNNCYGEVTNTINNSYCFLPSNDGVTKINGGEYRAYTGASSAQSSVIGQSSANAVSILNGVSAPTVAKSGYYQTNSVLQWAGGGQLRCTDLISALPLIVVASISNIVGTIELSKPNMA